MRKILLIVVVFSLLAVTGLFAAGTQESGGAKDGKEPITVGVSNGQITNTWRTQMVSDINQEFQYYKGLGLVDDLRIQHAGNDVNLQISQIRTMVNSGIDLLLVNPLSSTALNPVLEEATAQGVLVIVFDQFIENNEIMQIAPNNVTFMQNMSQYVIDEIGGAGDIVYVSGYDGQPANTLRDNTVYGVLKEYPDIKVLTKINGNWDPTTAQQAMADVLAAFPNIDGVISQDGMQLGIIKAFENAHRELVPITGDSTVAFLEKWIELKKSQGFSTVAYINGPGFTANLALGIGIRMLQGKELKSGLLDGPRMSLELEQINNDNVEQLYKEHIENRGIADFIDGWYSQERIDSMFQ